MGNEEDKTKGLLWRLPLVQSRDVGKIGPAFGYGIGCGVGFGIGLLGGAGLGVGVPGVQFGVGIGAGCGVGLGFGYGVGRGWAHDENGARLQPCWMTLFLPQREYLMQLTKRLTREDDIAISQPQWKFESGACRP